MKKLILALLTAGTIATANAQEPRSVLLYGDVNFNTDRQPSLVKLTDWNVSPGIGYQFNHNWTLGLALSWAQHAAKDAAGVKTTENWYSAGPFARYSSYIHRSEIFFWFAQLEFAYRGGYTTTGGNPASNKHNGIYSRLFPALGINVGHGIALNFAIGGLSYASDKVSTNAYSDNQFNFTFGRQMNFGISKNFNCAHKMHSHHEPGDEVHRRKADHMEDEDDAAPTPKRKQRNRDEDE
ncbi:MAG: hypothetical protein V4649_04150 [Bacteroidota bacterium]